MDGDLRLELSDSEDVDSNWETSRNDEETDEEEIDISDEEESEDGQDAIVEIAPEPGAKAGTSGSETQFRWRETTTSLELNSRLLTVWTFFLQEDLRAQRRVWLGLTAA